MTFQPQFIDRIRTTLDTYDPERRTIAIGSSAIVLSVFETVPEISEALWTAVGDVDVLAEKDFVYQYDRNRGGTVPPGARMYYIDRYIGGTNELRTEAAITLVPNEAVTDLPLLPFTALTNLSDDLHDINYAEALDRSTVTPDGYRVLSIEEVLKWKIAVGRPKDMKMVQTVLELVGRSDLTVDIASYQ